MAATETRRWEVSLDRDLKPWKSRRLPARADAAFEVARRTVGRDTVLSVRGELDVMNAPELGRAVHRALTPRPHQLVIDLRRVGFVDYRGLSVLLSARRRALNVGVDLSLACDVPNTLRLLEHTRLDRDFDIHPTSAAALRQRAGPAASAAALNVSRET